MQIRIREKDGTNRWIPLPTGLIFNGLTASIAAKTASGYGVTITARQMNRLFAIVRRYKKAHPDWVLVDVQSADGDHVMVKL